MRPNRSQSVSKAEIVVENKELKFYKIDIDTQSCLYQNFYVIGLDDDIIFSEDFYKNTKLDKYSPKVISKFPSTAHSLSSVPDELIIQHCFPYGFKLENIQIPPQKFFFSFDDFFLIDQIKSDLDKIYFSCILFYEDIENYKELYKKWKQYEEGNNKEDLKNDREDNSEEEKKKEKEEEEEINTKSKENNNGDINTNPPSDSSIKKKQNIFVPKVICLSSLLPFYKETLSMLELLINKNGINPKNSVFPIEKIIENIIYSIPLPSYGFNKRSFKLYTEQFIFERNSINELNLPLVNLSQLFEIFPVETIFDICKCILLELPLLIFGTQKEELCTIITGLLSLIYPFKYQYPIATILPTNCFSIIETYDAFILGINDFYSETFFEKYSLSDKRTYIIVDIEKRRLFAYEGKEDLKPNIFLNKKEKEENKSTLIYNVFKDINLPDHYLKKYTSKVNSIIKKKEQNPHQSEESFTLGILNEFFGFIICIIQDYLRFYDFNEEKRIYFDSAYLSKEKMLSINAFISVNDYIKYVKTDEQPFYQRFLNSKIFLDFMIRKIYPRSPEEGLSLLYFDEKIQEKKNKYFFSRNVKIVSLEDRSISPKTTNDLEIIKPKGFSRDEFCFISLEKSKKKALKYFQDISTEYINNKEIEVRFTYYVFPKLLYDDYFFEKSYSKIFSENKIKIAENLLKIPREKYQKFLDTRHFEIYRDINYNFNFYQKSSAFQLSNREYVNQIWLILICGSLWYCDIYERNYRFDQILNKLKEIEYIENNILEFILLCIFQYGTEAQLVKIYEFISNNQILNIKYINIAMLCQKMTKNINTQKTGTKNDLRHSKVTLLSRETSYSEYLENLNKKKYIPKRKIFNYEDEEIFFDTSYKCPKCTILIQIENNDINENICSNKFFVYCPNCNAKIGSNYLQFKILIKGLRKDEAKIENINEFNLQSPFWLFQKTKENFFSATNYKIDIVELKKYKDLFYNYIFYFYINGLPFDFLLPLADKKENVEGSEFTSNCEIQNKIEGLNINYERKTKPRRMDSDILNGIGGYNNGLNGFNSIKNNKLRGSCYVKSNDLRHPTIYVKYNMNTETSKDDLSRFRRTIINK